VWTAATTTDLDGRAEMIRRLAEGPKCVVDDVVRSCFDRIAAALVRRGWPADDAKRFADRRLDASAAAAVARALAHDVVVGGGQDRTSAMSDAVRALRFLTRLPPFPDVDIGHGRAPGRRTATDDRMLERVRALLAKAESTTFPEEAEALTAKAQQLMARHAIDAAMLDDGDDSGEVESLRLWLDRPYEAEKSRLAAQVAWANRCRPVWIKDIGVVIVIGYSADLAVVELLFTSLLVQATRAMTAAPRRDDGRTRAFRRSFLIGYASRIGERLSEAADAATSEAALEHGDALLPVLARRTDAVDEATDAAFPHLKRVGGRVGHAEGYRAGRAAADLASLDAGPAIEGRQSA